MRDFKHLLDNDSSQPSRGSRSIATYAIILVVVVVVAVLSVRKGAQAISSWQQGKHKTKTTQSEPARSRSLFSTAQELIPQATITGDRLTASTTDGMQYTYSIDPELQKRVSSFMRTANPPYAVFIAMEPATGRILSMTSHSSLDSSWFREGPYLTFPMASLFKMITATAALEQQKINPGTVISFRGRLVSESPRQWDPSPKHPNISMDVTTAMGKSVNPIYGRIASDFLGRDALHQTCNRFGFNKDLFSPEVPVFRSQARLPEGVEALRLQGCGLDHDLKVSPLHALAIVSALGNKGVMVEPRLLDKLAKKGKELPVPAAKTISQVTTPETAHQVTQMLLTAVTSGTSRKAFNTPQGRKLKKDVKIAAKTGSIDGDNPKGHYSWFAAYAPADQPRIAVVALVINGDRWKIKATQLGEVALTTYLKSPATK